MQQRGSPPGIAAIPTGGACSCAPSSPMGSGGVAFGETRLPTVSAIAKRYSHTLDLIRFAVCVFVALAHIAPRDLLGSELSVVLSSGICSTIFFAMSGFILCQTSGFWRESWRRIAIQRIARLYPLHVVGFAVLIPFLFLGKDSWPAIEIFKQVLWNASGLQAFGRNGQSGIELALNGPAWSITPLLLGGMALPVLRWAGLRLWTAGGLLGFLIALCAFRIAITLLAPPVSSPVDIMLRHTYPLPHILEILCGGICYILLTRIDAPLGRWLQRDTTLFLATGLIVLPLWAAVTLNGAVACFYVVHGPVFPAVLLLVAAAYFNGGRVESLSRAKWVKTGGEMSILVYLFHTPVWQILERIGIRSGLPEHILRSAPVIGGVMLVVLAAAYLGLRPAEVTRRWVSGLLDRWTGSTGREPVAPDGQATGGLLKLGESLGLGVAPAESLIGEAKTPAEESAAEPQPKSRAFSANA